MPKKSKKSMACYSKVQIVKSWWHHKHVYIEMKQGLVPFNSGLIQFWSSASFLCLLTLFQSSIYDQNEFGNIIFWNRYTYVFIFIFVIFLDLAVRAGHDGEIHTKCGCKYWLLVAVWLGTQTPQIDHWYNLYLEWESKNLLRSWTAFRMHFPVMTSSNCQI